MRIEQIGFYETRDGRLAYALARLPDELDSEYSWAVCYANGGADYVTDEGRLYREEEEHSSDLVRYLPTVKSWNDPIPPPEPPAVTVYTEWLSIGPSAAPPWTGWTKGDVKPCYAVAKLRTVEVPAND
jgi:hypothetical protein